MLEFNAYGWLICHLGSVLAWYAVEEKYIKKHKQNIKTFFLNGCILLLIENEIEEKSNK